MKMNIEDVKISKAFMLHPPKPEKIASKRAEIEKFGGQICPIILNKEGVLTDGYATLLALKELGYNDVECSELVAEEKAPEKKIYVYGTHLRGVVNNPKEYVWRLKKTQLDMELKPGDTILAQTCYGIKPVIVMRVEMLERPPIEGHIKRVVRKV